MKINISAIANEATLSEVNSSVGTEVVGGNGGFPIPPGVDQDGTALFFNWNSQTKGETSWQALQVNEAYALPGETNLNFGYVGSSV